MLSGTPRRYFAVGVILPFSSITDKNRPEATQVVHQKFDSMEIHRELGRRTVYGGAITVVGRAASLTISLLRTAILARLLVPDDFGLIGMVTVVTGFILLFRDSGLSAATVQQKEITHQQISNLFWINLFLSILCGTTIALLAPVLVWFFQRPELLWITIGLAGSVVFSGLVVQHDALLRRQMLFGRLVSVQLGGEFIGLLAAGLLAWADFRYWSLVWSQYALGIFTVFAMYAACPWRPGWLSRGSGVIKMLHFGKNITGFEVLNFFARNGDNLLIGKVCGAAPLGIYSRAYSILVLPLLQVNAPLAAVAVPALSRLQDDPTRYRHYYFSAIRIISSVTMPLVAFMMAMSSNVILIVLGPNWEEVADIFFWFGITGLIQPVSNTIGWLFISQARVRELFHWGILGSSMTIVFFLIGLPWGILGVAISYSLGSTFLVTPILYWWGGRRGPVKMRDLYSQLAVPLASSVVLLLLLLQVHNLECISNRFVETAVGMLCAMVLTAALIVRDRTGRELVGRLLQILVPAFGCDKQKLEKP